MSSIFQTTGIILSRRDFREADRWYTALTPEHGKIEFLGRGARKPLAKLSPHMEMVAEIDFMVVRGKIWNTIAGTERKRAFSEIYTDLGRLTLAQNALHLVDIGTRAEEAEPVLYAEVIAFLAFVNESPSLSEERAGHMLGVFALKLMAIIGYRPELNRCLGCKNNIEAGKYRWHSLKGGVVCMHCCERDQEQWFAARGMSDDALKLIRFALTEPFPDQLKPHLKGEDLLAFHDAVEGLIISHFPTIPASSLRAASMV